MARCELVDTCIFFNDRMGGDPSMNALYRVRYCRSSPKECARYMVFSALGREAVPPDLYPNDVLRAMRITGTHRIPVPH